MTSADGPMTAAFDIGYSHGREDERAVWKARAEAAEAESARLSRELEGEREARARLDHAYREKDRAMGVLFKRLNEAGVDCSDLIP